MNTVIINFILTQLKGLYNLSSFLYFITCPVLYTCWKAKNHWKGPKSLKEICEFADATEGSQREGNAKAKSLIDECVVTDVGT